MRELDDLITQFKKQGIRFSSLTEAIDTSTASGKLYFHTIAAFAEYEREGIRERTRAGVAAARARGRKGGRKHKLSPAQRTMVINAYHSQTPIRDICHQFRISHTTITASSKPISLNSLQYRHLCRPNPNGAEPALHTARKSTRFTAPLFLLPSLFVAQVLFYQTVALQRASWHEDTTPPLTVTSEWKPDRTYSPEIERSIAALSQSDPDKVKFLRERGIPIHILTPAQMAVSGCPPSSIGCTRHADSSINVVAGAAVSPVSLAVVLSHELTHCRLHDKALGMAVPRVWSRLLLRNEESKAHVAGLSTAQHLGFAIIWRATDRMVVRLPHLVLASRLGCFIRAGVSFRVSSNCRIHQEAREEVQAILQRLGHDGFVSFSRDTGHSLTCERAYEEERRRQNRRSEA